VRGDVIAEQTIQIRSGGRAAELVFARLVETELASAYATASLLLGDQNEAEDAVQDAMVKAWQRLHQLRDQSRLGAWFGRILINQCRDRLRHRTSTRVRWVLPTPDQSIGQIAERDALLTAIGMLPPEQRIVVVLRFYQDLSLKALAERTGVPIGTVKSRLHNGLQAVRAAYDGQARLDVRQR
jgi:RNA polymerase sigma factor (sigma-70 family)